MYPILSRTVSPSPVDEATSALDAESEHMVQNAIDGMLIRGRNENGHSMMTVIIVAHRLSTVRSADRIFVIKEGNVVEQGSHDELVQDPDGAYSSLIRRQMLAQEKLENGDDESPNEGAKHALVSMR
jgi:ABC-type multidrug transport system fused ATPase/permease subunit